MKSLFLVAMMLMLAPGAATQHAERTDRDSSGQEVDEQKSEQIIHGIRFGEALRKVYQDVTRRKSRRIDSLEQLPAKQ